MIKIAEVVEDLVRQSPFITGAINEGLINISPLGRPTRTAPMGPWNGISEISKAADAPTSATISGS